MSQSLQVLQMFSVMLYYYYLSYKRKPYVINQEVCNQLFQYLVQLMNYRYPWFNMNDPKYILDCFILFEKPFDEYFNLTNHENLYSDILQSFIDFPQNHYYEIDNDYNVLSIAPVPFDSLDITHGMLINFFTPLLE